MKMIITTDRDRSEFIRVVSQIPINRKFVGEFKVYRMKRSPSQNSLYWMWLHCLEKESETGNTAKDFHEYFRQEYLIPERVMVCGREILRYPSTTRLDTKQMHEYLERVEGDALKQGVSLPRPDDLRWEQFMAKYGDQ